MASRTEKSTRTAVASFLNSTLGKVLAFVSKTAFINVFGREMLGLNGLFSNVISLLCLADLGFGTAMAYSYYKPIAENDTKKIAALNKFYSKVYLIIAGAVSVAGVAFVPFLDSFVISITRLSICICITASRCSIRSARTFLLISRRLLPRISTDILFPDIPLSPARCPQLCR